MNISGLIVEFLSKILFFSIFIPPFGDVLGGGECPKTIQLLSSPRLIFGPNFSALSQTVLELSRQKKRDGWIDGWMDGQIKINRLAIALAARV